MNREKFRAMTGKQKIEYLWMYYKWVLAVAAFIILLISIVVSGIMRSFQEEQLYVSIVDGGYANGVVFGEDVEKYICEKSTDYTTVDTLLITDQSGELDYTSVMQLTTKAAAGELDILICPEKVYDYYKEQGLFLKIEDIVGAEFTEKYAERISEYALNIANNEVMEAYAFDFTEPTYLGICNSSKHPENAVKFLEFLGYK